MLSPVQSALSPGQLLPILGTEGEVHVILLAAAAELHRREDPWPARASAIHEPGLVENVHGRVRGRPCGHEPAVSWPL